MCDQNKEHEQLDQTIQHLRRELELLNQSKCTQEALNETEYIRSELYRGILEISPDAIFITDKDFRVIMCNKYAATLCGYTDMQEIIGKKIFDFVHPSQLPQALQTADEVIRNKKVRRREFLIQKKDTSSFWGEVSVSTIYNNQATPQGFLGVMRDMTAQKEIEDTLRESEQQHQNVLNTLPCAIHVVDRDLRIVLFNNAFLQWNKELGLDTNVIGEKLSEAFPFLSTTVFDQYEHVFQTGQQTMNEEVTLIKEKRIKTRTHKIPVFKKAEVIQVVTTIYPLNEHD